MKKLLVLILAIMVVAGIGGIMRAEVCAEEITISGPERTVRDVLIEKANEQNLQSIFFTEEKLPDDLKGYGIEGKPIVKWLYGTYGKISENNACELLMNLWEEEKFAQFFLWVCEEEVFQAISYFPSTAQYHEPEKLFRHYEAPYAEMDKFVYSVLSGSATQTFGGKQYAVKDIVIYGCNNVTNPPCAVYFTDGGEFVRVGSGYDDSDFVEYTWDDFVLYWNAYYEYKLSKAYGPNGEPLNGGIESFHNFANDIYPNWENIPTKVDNDTPQYTWMIWVGFGVLVCCVVAVVLVKKRKNVQEGQMTEIIE